MSWLPCWSAQIYLCSLTFLYLLVLKSVYDIISLTKRFVYLPPGLLRCDVNEEVVSLRSNKAIKILKCDKVVGTASHISI